MKCLTIDRWNIKITMSEPHPRYKHIFFNYWPIFQSKLILFHQLLISEHNLYLFLFRKFHFKLSVLLSYKNYQISFTTPDAFRISSSFWLTTFLLIKISFKLLFLNHFLLFLATVQKPKTPSPFPFILVHFLGFSSESIYLF